MAWTRYFRLNLPGGGCSVVFYVLGSHVEKARGRGRSRPWLYSLAERCQQYDLPLEEVAASNWAFSACAEHSSMLTYFSVFYWPVTAADVRGGDEKVAEGRGRGVSLYRWGGWGASFFFFFPADGLSLRAADAGAGSWPWSWTEKEQSDAPLLVLYILTFCSETSKMAATGFLWYWHWNGERSADYGQCSGWGFVGVTFSPEPRPPGVLLKVKPWRNCCSPPVCWLKLIVAACAGISGNCIALQLYASHLLKRCVHQAQQKHSCFGVSLNWASGAFKKKKKTNASG